MSIRNRIATGITVTGLAIGFSSWGHDVLTCPGEVKGPFGPESAPILYCDENPQANNIGDNPGTPEQKIMYAAYLLAAMGGISLYRNRQRLPLPSAALAPLRAPTGAVTGSREAPPSPFLKR
jgi:hypothetical protein